MCEFDQLPGRVEPVLVGLGLPKFDIERSVVRFGKFSQPGHHELSISIAKFYV